MQNLLGGGGGVLQLYKTLNGVFTPEQDNDKKRLVLLWCEKTITVLYRCCGSVYSYYYRVVPNLMGEFPGGGGGAAIYSGGGGGGGGWKPLFKIMLYMNIIYWAVGE